MRGERRGDAFPPSRSCHLNMLDDRDGSAVLARLFREGEDMEGIDSGAFLDRVIGLQDELLRRGGVSDGGG